jgi:hypothetical protein
VIACLLRRSSLVLGEFGTGKTEVTIALGRRIAATGERVAIVDLDIVTPYFRSRDIREVLAGEGIEVIAPAGNLAVTELPAIPPAMGSVMGQGSRGSRTVLVDVGGGVEGAHAVKHLLPQLEASGLNGLLILNRHRPAGNAAGLGRFVSGLRAKGIPVTHALSNTHLCTDSTFADWIAGVEWAREMASELGLPLIGAAVATPIEAEAEAAEVGLPLLPIPKALRFPWEV